MTPKPQNTNFHQKYFEPIAEKLDAIGKQIVDAAYTVHKNLGPGLLEKVYEICFCHELSKRGYLTNARLMFQSFMITLNLTKGCV